MSTESHILKNKKTPVQERLERNLTNVVNFLAANTGVTVSFTDDPEVTGYFSYATMEIVLSTAWLAEHTPAEQVFLASHETGHLVDFRNDTEGFRTQIQWVHTQGKIAAQWLSQKIATSAQQKGTTIDRDALTEQVAAEATEMVRIFWNCLDDIFVNRWSQDNVGRVDSTLLRRLYEHVSFPTKKLMTGVPLHRQFAYALLRDTMIGEPSTDTDGNPLWSAEVREKLATPYGRTTVQEAVAYYNRDQKSKPVEAPVEISKKEEKVQETRKKMKTDKFLSASQRWFQEKGVPFTLYYELWKKDMEQMIDENLEELLKKMQEQAEKNKEGGKEGEGQTDKSKKGGGKGQGEQGEDGEDEQEQADKNKEEGQKTDKPGSSRGTSRPGSIFDKDDLPGTKKGSMLDSLLGKDEQESMKKIDELKKELEKRAHENSPEGQMEKKQKLQQQAAARELGVSEYTLKDYAERVAKNSSASRHLSEIFDRILGDDTGESYTETIQAPKGKLSIQRVIKEFASLHQENPRIFEQKEIQESKENIPLTVNMRLVFDCSGSMGGNGEQALRDIYAIISNAFEVYEHRYKMKFPSPKFKITFNISVLKYGNDYALVRPLSGVSSLADKSSTLKAYSQISADMGGTNDIPAIEQTIQQINETTTKVQTEQKEAPIEIVFFITDGASGNQEGELTQVVHELGSHSIARGIQVAAGGDTTFDSVWNSHPSVRGIQLKRMKDLPAVCAELLSEILEGAIQYSLPTSKTTQDE